MADKEVRVRYAPSPTGLQHIGGVTCILCTGLALVVGRLGPVAGIAGEGSVSTGGQHLLGVGAHELGGGGGVVVTGNTFYVRSDRDIEAIGVAINQQAERERRSLL